MINIKKFTFNLFNENTYLLWDDSTKDAAIIDPGCHARSEEYELQNFIASSCLNLKYLINTHCHIDHILGCSFVKEKYNPLYLAPEKDIPLLVNVSQQAQMVGMDFSFSPLPDEYLTENTKIILGKTELIFLSTPGHTPGEFCVHILEEYICFTGDVLFFDSIGRTDLWGGNYNTLMNSISEKLLNLPSETVIYPGHGDQSTIGREKSLNPFLQG